MIEQHRRIRLDRGHYVPRGHAAINRPEWHERAKCRDVTDDGLFHRPDTASRAQAKAFCWSGCEVRTECLLWALENRDTHAVMGGHTPTERAHILGGAA